MIVLEDSNVPKEFKEDYFDELFFYFDQITNCKQVQEIKSRARYTLGKHYLDDQKREGDAIE